MIVHVVMLEECCGYESRPEPIAVKTDLVEAEALAKSKSTGSGRGGWSEDHAWVESFEVDSKEMQHRIRRQPYRRKN